MSHSRLLGWEVTGFVFIAMLGIPLHFCFEWSGHSRLIGLFSPVNESTWEHFKLCLWPGVLFALIEFRAIRRQTNSYWKAKALGLLSMPVALVVLFYSYTALLGYHVLLVDILVFFLAVAIGQIISYWILKSTTSASRWWAAVIIVTALALVVFTYNPPHLFLFRDPVTSRYGVMHAPSGHQVHE